MPTVAHTSQVFKNIQQVMVAKKRKPAGMGAADYARHREELGLDDPPALRKTLSAAIANESIPLTADGLIDVARADAEWAPSNVGRKRGASAAAPDPTVTKSRQIFEQLKAQRELAKWRREQGTSIDAAEAGRTARAFARRIRDAVLGIPDDAQRALEGKVLCKCGEPVDAKHLALEIERHLRGVLEVLAADPMGSKEP